MRRLVAIVLVALGFGGVLLSQGASLALAEEPHAALIEIDDAIHASSARFLARAIEQATEDGA